MVLPRVRMIPGEAHRDRILTVNDEKAYFEAAQALGFNALAMYQCALEGIRATQRGEVPIKPRDPFLLRDAATILLDCGTRPEECFRLRWENVPGDVIEITYGKTDNARRRVPLSQRAAAILNLRRQEFPGECSLRPPEAATLNLRLCKASTPRRARWQSSRTSRSTRTAIRA
jgi:integrase